MEELNEEKLEEASGGKGLSESLDYALEQGKKGPDDCNRHAGKKDT